MKKIRDILERGLRSVAHPVIELFIRAGIHPNVISFLGFLITCASGFVFHSHHVRTAGLIVLIGGLFDMFDGTVARRTGLASSFGAFYDSTLDRLSEIVVYLGLLSLYNDYSGEPGHVGMIYAIVLAMAGSLMISYTRARAESLGVDCYVGLMQRPERVILIGFAALIGGDGVMFGYSGFILRVAILVLAILTNLTVLQRIWWVYRSTRPDGEPKRGQESTGEPDRPGDPAPEPAEAAT